MNGHLSDSRQCSQCTKIVSENDIHNHILNCRSTIINESFEKNPSIQMKICPFCEKSVEDLFSHCQTCVSDEDKDDSIFQTPRDQSPIQINEIVFVDKTNSNQKRCILCSKYINEYDFEKHSRNCLNDNVTQQQQQHSTNEQKPSETTIKSIKTTSIEEDHSTNFITKKCILCSQNIDEKDFIVHMTICSSNQLQNNSNNENKKQYTLYSNFLNESEDNSSCSIDQKNPKIEYSDVISKSNELKSKINQTTLNSLNYDHINTCDTSSNKVKSKKRDCILCFKAINIEDYENHVSLCLNQNEQILNRKCFSCNRSKENDNDVFYLISCDYNHQYCLICLQKSLKEFALNREKPVCWKNKCDYELSRHDISSIPLERRWYDRLLHLVQGKQRPFCSKCKFYINLNEYETFDDHFEQCNDNLIPCEFCYLPYSINQLENHSRECRSNEISFNEKFIEFIVFRTKYPFTKEQIRFFLQQQNKSSSSSSIDPHSIIQTLAVYGSTFPFDLPRRDCDICFEACPYDDIYVFDCSDSHKLCYQCYYQSCQTKMSNGEILTCALCPNVLKESEINQLRISIEELKKIQDYQIKKTFDVYSSRTVGIIKCPKQDCTWIAEAADPNERFKVNCPLCQHEFCSLCNQQYHYRTTCQQLPQITQRWFFWCQTERERYLRQRAQQDATYQAQLNEYNQKRKENENRNRDLRRRYDELMNDEQYKAQNCRLCPSCRRVVQRLEGCDSMVCGQDAHGGNVQSGCGHKFNWQQAQPYQPSTTKQPKQVILDLPRPENAIVHHNGIKCDHCQNDVNGIRFDCVHCPSLTFCEKCEQQSTLNHSEENLFLDQQQHVFKLIMTPEEEAFQF